MNTYLLLASEEGKEEAISFSAFEAENDEDAEAYAETLLGSVGDGVELHVAKLVRSFESKG